MLAPQSVLAWIIIGAIAGWLAGRLVKGQGFGLIGNIVIGILGAGIAGILAPALGLYTTSTGGNIVAATVGALVLLFLVNLVRRT
ncbi:MAG TPA: GlsB/YeaQ/YmgE family stress response membrane protein [Hyphomicrobiaceae bacterium]|nr:GlsB/YeaQ/YmgE family stress response membrane protein [Hyphomicrobiaceae bacterium]